MSRYSRNPKALTTTHRLRQIAFEWIEADGWTIEKIAGNRKSSIRRTTKGPETQIVAVRTSQDAHVGFDRNASDTAWRTLDDVNYVIIAALDLDDPRFATIHKVPADELREWYNAKRAAREAAGGQGDRRQNWIPLFKQHAAPRYDLLHKYIGEVYPADARVPLEPEVASAAEKANYEPTDYTERRVGIIERKKLELAADLGVAPSSIHISIIDV